MNDVHKTETSLINRYCDYRYN